MTLMVRIGMWGTFDVENYGDALFPRIGRAELARRLPEAEIRAFSPLGSDHPTRFDSGDTAEPLGRYAPDRLARLAEELDCVIVGGGEIIHDHDWELAPHYGRSAEELTALAPSRFFIDGLGPELEEECPVVWHAVGLPFDVPPAQVSRYREALTGRPYLSVRDDISKRRLEEAGVARGVALVPDPAVLLPRLLDADLLDRRLRYLRAIGSYPVRGTGLVVQGSRVLLRWIEELAPAVARLAEDLAAPVVLLETGPSHGDGEFAAALSGRLPGPVYRVTEVGVEDVAAVIAGSAGFVGNSLHGNITAFAFGRPHVILGLNEESKLEGFARLIDAEACLAERPEEVASAFHRTTELGHRADLRAGLQARVDRHFDRLADVARQAASRRVRRDPTTGSPMGQERHLAALRRAFEARGRRLAIQRWRLADRVAELEREHEGVREKAERLEAEVADLRAANTTLEEEVAGRKAEVERLLNTRTFRYTKPFREAWGRIRRRGPES
jgi:polysaccharide pyruvyl transferase WcaK-like protein